MEKAMKEIIDLLADVQDLDAQTIGEYIQDIFMDNEITRIEVDKLDSSTFALFDGEKRIHVTVK